MSARFSPGGMTRIRSAWHGQVLGHEFGVIPFSATEGVEVATSFAAGRHGPGSSAVLGSLSRNGLHRLAWRPQGRPVAAVISVPSPPRAHSKGGQRPAGFLLPASGAVSSILCAADLPRPEASRRSGDRGFPAECWNFACPARSTKVRSSSRSRSQGVCRNRADFSCRKTLIPPKTTRCKLTFSSSVLSGV